MYNRIKTIQGNVKLPIGAVVEGVGTVVQATGNGFYIFSGLYRSERHISDVQGRTYSL